MFEVVAGFIGGDPVERLAEGGPQLVHRPQAATAESKTGAGAQPTIQIAGIAATNAVSSRAYFIRPICRPLR